MKNKFPSFYQLNKILLDERKCVEFLFEKEILKKPTKCLHCGYKILYFVSTRKIFTCANCIKQTTSVLKNTIFYKHKLKCNEILLIGYLWLIKARYTTIKKFTGHDSSTIIRFIKMFRNIIAKSLVKEDTKIGGERVIVEIDESKFKKNESWWTVGIVERTKLRKCFFKIVKDRNANTLKRLIKTHVKPGSTIYSNSWKG